MKLTRILALLAGLTGCTTLSQPPSVTIPPVTAAAAGEKEAVMPRFKPGQQWAYRRIDLWRNQEIERFHQEISREEGGRWKLVWTIIESEDRQRRGSVTDESFSASTHGFADPGLTGRHDPLRFPLSPGKTWDFAYTAKVKANTIRVTQRATVTGWETVTVPAGSFRALRVEHRGSYSATDGSFGWSGNISETYWYAPKAQRIVKREYHDTKGDGTTWDHWRDELVEMYL